MDPAAWTTLAILITGVVVVIGGILVLKLHAFLALILAALIVSALTPAPALERFALQQNAFAIDEIDSEQHRLILRLSEKQSLREGTLLIVTRPDAATGRFEEVAEVIAAETLPPSDSTERRGKRVVARIRSVAEDRIVQTSNLAVPPPALASARNFANQTIADRVADAFGSTAASIGILIAMASIIGKCLLDSGAADRIVRRALHWVGEDRAPAAFLGSGFLLGIPVFFDTVFYLMIPLGKALRMRTGRNYLLYVLTIVAGATMAHSLVPPTPGPLFVAEALGVSIGTMILAGCVVGIFTSGFGYLYAHAISRWSDVPLRESAEASLAELEATARRDERELPPFWLSLTPILLPVVLIGGYEILKSADINLSPWAEDVARTLGDKNIALVLAAAVALLLLIRQKGTSRDDLARAVQSALASGGIIILITAAGGAFGKALQQTGVADLIGGLTTTQPAIVVLMAFLITTAVRTAQGSATVAMITAVGILAGMASSIAFDPVYLALAIGCGSKPIAWMNDSGFWVITRMSGMTEAEGLKFVTPMTALMGVVGVIVVMIGVTVLPHPFG